MRTRHLLLAAAAAGVAAAYDRCRVLDCANGFKLSWTINYAGGFIEATMEAQAMGYVSVGLTTSANMVGSDIIVGWVPSMSAPSVGYVRDYNVGAFQGQPALDASQDVTFLGSGFRADGVTMFITWRRALNTSDATGDKPFTPGRAQQVLWASQPSMGAVTQADGSRFTKHASNTRGQVSIDFGAPSSCDCVCGPAPPRRIDVARAGACLGNGWTPAEAAGDRDGGAAAPRVVVQRTRNVTRLVPVNVTVTPSGTLTGSATSSPPATATPSPGASASGTASVAATPSGSASVAASGSVTPTPGGSPTGTPTPSSTAGVGSAIRLPSSRPDAVARPAYMSSDGAFKAAWSLVTTLDMAASGLSTPPGGSPTGMLFEFALTGLAPGSYGGLGFNPAPAAMVGADMLVAWVAPRTAGTSCVGLAACAAFVGDYASTGFSPPTLETASAGAGVAGASNVALVHASWDAGARLARIMFYRPLMTGDPGDADLSIDRRHQLMYALGPAPPGGNPGALPMHFQAGQTGSRTYDVYSWANAAAPIVAPGGSAAADRRARLMALHGCAMVVAWWLAMIAGVAVARYRHLYWWLLGVPGDGGKSAGMVVATPSGDSVAQLDITGGAVRGRRPPKQRWFWAHLCCQLSGAGAALAGLVAVLIAKAGSDGVPSRISRDWTAHERLGAASLVLLSLQVVLGAARPNPNGLHRPAWMAAHRLLAGLTFALGSLATFYGYARMGALSGEDPGAAAAKSTSATSLAGAAVAFGTLHLLCAATFALAAELVTLPPSSSLGGLVARCGGCCGVGGRRAKPLAAAATSSDGGAPGGKTVDATDGGDGDATPSSRQLTSLLRQQQLQLQQPAAHHPPAARTSLAPVGVGVVSSSAASVEDGGVVSTTTPLPQQQPSAPHAEEADDASKPAPTAAPQQEMLPPSRTAALSAWLRPLSMRAANTALSPMAAAAARRLLAVGAVSAAVTGIVLLGLTAALAQVAVGAKSGALADGDAPRRLAAAAPLPRALQETIWVNQTFQEVYNETVPLSTYPGGPRDVCFWMNTTVPAVETSYLCRGFALPPGVDLHATSFEFMADRADLAHHAVLFTSWVDMTRTSAIGMADLGGGTWDCANTPSQMMGVAYAWAVGQTGEEPLPPRVGFRVGTPPGTLPSSYSQTMRGVPFVFLQLHYNNPSRLAGVRDTSGLRLRVSDALQPIEGGLLWLGTAVSGTGAVVIPPGKTAFGQQSTFTLPASLPAASAINPLTSTYVVSSIFYHMHLTGRRIWADTVRGGSLVPAGDGTGRGQLLDDVAYNFEMQAYTRVNATLAPGDTLRLRCVFTNTPAYGTLVGNPKAAAGQAVVGGEQTSDEMCMAFAFMYPVPPAWGGIFLTAASTFCDDGPSPAVGTACAGLPR